MTDAPDQRSTPTPTSSPVRVTHAVQARAWIGALVPVETVLGVGVDAHGRTLVGEVVSSGPGLSGAVLMNDAVEIDQELLDRFVDSPVEHSVMVSGSAAISSADFVAALRQLPDPAEPARSLTGEVLVMGAEAVPAAVPSPSSAPALASVPAPAQPGPEESSLFALVDGLHQHRERELRAPGEASRLLDRLAEDRELFDAAARLYNPASPEGAAKIEACRNASSTAAMAIESSSAAIGRGEALPSVVSSLDEARLDALRTVLDAGVRIDPPNHRDASRRSLDASQQFRAAAQADVQVGAARLEAAGSEPEL